MLNELQSSCLDFCKVLDKVVVPSPAGGIVGSS